MGFCSKGGGVEAVGQIFKQKKADVPRRLIYPIYPF